MNSACIYLFDMDHTLLDNDCDVSWKSFLVERGLAPADSLAVADGFYRDYVENRLDIERFMAFQLAEFRGRTRAEMRELARLHFEQYARPRLYKDAIAMVEQVGRQGCPRALLTATNRVVALPVAEHLRIPQVLAVRPRLADGCYTGDFIPPYSGGEGKVPLAGEFAREHGCELSQAAYFGDSLADLPILRKVGFPTVVNPGRELREVAVREGWPVVRWR